MKFILLLIFIVLFYGCSTVDETFDCTTCTGNQVCNTEKTACETFDCSTCIGNQVCNAEYSGCVDKFDCTTCTGDQVCNAEKTACETFDCTTCVDLQECNEERNGCVDKVVVFDCATCTGDQVCNAEKTACETFDCASCNDDEECNAEKNGCIDKIIDNLKTIDEIKAMTEGMVVLKDVIVTFREMKDNSDRIQAFIVEKDGKGLYIYMLGATVDSTGYPVTGDIVTIHGEISHYYGLSELKITDEVGSIIKTGEGIIPEAVVGILPLGDPQESILVVVDGRFTITEMGSSENKYATQLIDDDGETLMIRSSLFNFTDDTTIGDGTVFTSITGFVTESYNSFAILPTQASDLVRQ